MTRDVRVSEHQRKRWAAEDKRSASYVSTYCNFAHRVKTGRPIGHECRIIPPAALRAEMANDFDTAIAILQRTPAVIVKGRPDAS